MSRAHRYLTLAFGVMVFPLAAMAHPRQDEFETAQQAAAAGISAEPQVRIEVRGAYRYIVANGIPDHETGRFPGRANPNAIAPQNYHFRVPVTPTAADTPIANKFPNLFGVAVNGVPLDPATNEWWKDDRNSGWNIEAIRNVVKPELRNLGIDLANAHVQPTGAYHYHSVPWPLLKKLGGEKKMTLIGYAADGYPVYGPYAYTKASDAKSDVKLMKSSYRLKTAARPGGEEGPGAKPDGTYTRDWEFAKGSGDLDECNGRTDVTPEYPDGTYYYVIIDEFPFIPRFFHGEPDTSFERRPLRRDRNGGGGPGGPRERP